MNAVTTLPELNASWNDLSTMAADFGPCCPPDEFSQLVCLKAVERMETGVSVLEIAAGVLGKLDDYLVESVSEASQNVKLKALPSWASGRADTDDLRNDLCVRLLQNRRSVRDLSGIDRWASVVGKRVRLSRMEQITASKRDPRSESPIEFVGVSRVDRAFGRILDRETLEQALSKIPSRQALAVRMRYLDGLDYDDIGKQMAISTGTARTLVSKGLRSLRNVM